MESLSRTYRDPTKRWVLISQGSSPSWWQGGPVRASAGRAPANSRRIQVLLWGSGRVLLICNHPEVDRRWVTWEVGAPIILTVAPGSVSTNLGGPFCGCPYNMRPTI